MRILTAAALCAGLLLGTARATLLESDWSRETPAIDAASGFGPAGDLGIFGDAIRTPVARATPELAAALRAIHEGRPADVPGLVESALSQPHAAAPAHELRGIAFAMQGDVARARAEFEAAVRADPRQATAVIKLGDLAAAEGRHEEAARFWERARGLGDGENPQLAQRLGLVAERKGEVGEAIAWYEKGIRETPPEYLGVRLNLAGLYNRTRQPARTVALLGAHPKRADSAAAQFHLGVARTQLGEYDAAIAALRRARDIDAGFWNAALALGVAQRLAGDVPESVATLGEAARLAPRSPLPVVELGHSLLAAGRPAEAIGAFEKAAALSGERPVFRLELAQAYLVAGEHDKALAVFEALSRIANAPIDVGLGLAATYQQAGRLDDAQKQFERLRASAPNDPRVLYQAGLFEAFRRNYDGAIRLLAAASADPAMRPQAMRALAFAHGQKRDFPKAIETARKLVTESRDKAAARLVLAVLLEEAGRTGEAVTEYEGVLEADPRQVLALNNLSVLRTEAGDVRSGLALAERAHRLAPRNAQVLDTWGWALHRAGRSRDAVAPLAEAAQRMPGSASVRYHLGAARWAAGEREQARKDLDASLELAPRSTWAPEARRLLAGG